MAHADRTLEDAVSGMSQEIKRQLDGARTLLSQDLVDEKTWAASAAKSKVLSPEHAAAITEHAEAVAAVAKLVWPLIDAGVDELTTRVAYGTQRLIADAADRSST